MPWVDADILFASSNEGLPEAPKCEECGEYSEGGRYCMECIGVRAEKTAAWLVEHPVVRSSRHGTSGISEVYTAAGQCKAAPKSGHRASRSGKFWG